MSGREGQGPIFLTGPMGSGKSTVARELAVRLGAEAVDLDEVIAAEAGRSIPEIFAAEGEAGFRDREAAALAGLGERPGPLVVATGGGAVLRPENRAELRRLGRTVYLYAPVDALLARIGDDPNRPLLQVDDPRAKLEALQAERDPLYREAEITVDTTGRTPAEIADDILARLEILPSDRVD